MTSRTNRRPAEVFPIGVFLREELDARGETVEHLAARIGWELPALVAVMDGNERMPARLAQTLERHFGSSAVFWMNLDMQYRRYRQ